MFVASAGEASESSRASQIFTRTIQLKFRIGIATLRSNALMELTYKILGGDGNQYGPITAEQFRAWAQEGRVGSDTRVLRSGATTWVAAATLPELGVGAPSAPAAPAPIRVRVPARDPDLEKRVKYGVSWLYWIAALSLVNSVAALLGSDWRFIIGLGITQFIDVFAMGFGSGGKVVAFVLDLLAAGILVVLGIFANKHHGWAAIVGMVLLALDGLIVAVAALAAGAGSFWISFAVHVWAIMRIFRGFQATRAMRG
jgi:hypothetical protein